MPWGANCWTWRALRSQEKHIEKEKDSDRTDEDKPSCRAVRHAAYCSIFPIDDNSLFSSFPVTLREGNRRMTASKAFQKIEHGSGQRKKLVQMKRKTKEGKRPKKK
jgi:hypothetical protein